MRKCVLSSCLALILAVTYALPLKESNLDLLSVRETANEVKFYLYTKVNPDTPQELLLNNKDSVENSNYNSIHQTKIIIHGWLGSHNSIPNKPIREAYLTQGNYNLISVDWNIYAKQNYVTARNKVPVVGAVIAEFVDFLHNEFHLSYDSLVVIGHSLGAHVAGFCGKSVQYGQLSYIVGLDPAGPLFDYNKPDSRLSESDAKYVQTIQTNGNGQGTLEPIGSAAFYGNWGRSQPGCGKDLAGKCSHDRCVYLYAEAVKGYNFSPMYKCNSYDNILNKKDCLDLVKGIKIGDPLQIERKTGIYHFTTNSEAPFGLL